MYKYIKRLLDIVFSIIFMILLLPLNIVLIVILICQVKNPFYHTTRVGYRHKQFTMYKFRTLKIDHDDSNYILDKSRLTPFTAWLRTMALDEIPQLWQVLIGHMSLIGPRPLPPAYEPYYYQNELARFNVKGGIIPVSSILLKPLLSWDEQLQYESYYAQHYNFQLDLKIFISFFKSLKLRKHTQYGEQIRELYLERH